MSLKVIGSFLLLTTMWLAPHPMPAMAQAQSDLKNPMIDVDYVDPKNADFRPIHDRLKARKVLETLRAFLAPLKLPERLLLKVDECGAAVDLPRPPLPALICYEYIQKIEELAPAEQTKRGISRADTITGAFVMAALHETARAVYSLLKIPVWGREEDAADKLAAFIMVEMGEDVALRTLTGTASFFEGSKTWNGSGFDFSEVVSPDQQRYYNYLCMAYGSDPDLFQNFMRRTLLQQRERARGCSQEYNKFKNAFEDAIVDKYVDKQLMETVRKMKWLQPDDGNVPKQ